MAARLQRTFQSWQRYTKVHGGTFVRTIVPTMDAWMQERTRRLRLEEATAPMLAEVARLKLQLAEMAYSDMSSHARSQFTL